MRQFRLLPVPRPLSACCVRGYEAAPPLHSLFLQAPELASRAVEADPVLEKGSLAAPDTQRLEEDRRQRAQGEVLVLCT